MNIFPHFSHLSIVCLKNLNDHGNAYLAFERSALLPDASKNPLIYLNVAVYYMQIKRPEMVVVNLNRFFSSAEHVSVRHEVSEITVFEYFL